jgi:2-dehydropantoate 2-reductase
MKVLIIGAGAVGISMGATLKESGAEVDFIARGETKDKINKDGIKRLGLLGDITIPAGCVTAYDDYGVLTADDYDYILITVKNTANEEVSEQLGTRTDILKDGGCLVFMQNGIGYEQPFLDYFDESVVYHSRVITGFKKDELNESTVTVHQAPVLIGSVYGYGCEPVEALAEALNSSGIPSRADDDVDKALWAKLIYNTTLNPLGAILNMSYGELAESTYAHAIMDTLIEETFMIMDAAGAETYWSNADEYRADFYGKLVPDTADHRSSTLQDIERGRKTEIDFMTGSLLNLASQYDVVVTMHSMIYYLIKALEEKF